jgi:tRNA(adenine34) deaminase
LPLAGKSFPGHSWPMKTPATRPDYMATALAYARRAAGRGEVPVGAVLVDGRSGKILVRRHNLTRAQCDPTAHAEMLAIRAGAKNLGTERLDHCDLYVTLEPCAMCAAAISFARLRRVYYGAPDPKGGGINHGARVFAQQTCFHAPEVISGLREGECGELLKGFFKARR